MSEKTEQKIEKRDIEDAKRKIIDIDTSLEDLLRYDREGFLLVFDIDSFKELDDGTRRSLTRENRVAYSVAEGIKLNKGAIGQSPSGVGTGGPLDMQYSNVELARNGMVHRYCRKDLQYKRERAGWKVASPSGDVKYASSMLEGGHFETKDPKTGQTDQILMVMPRDKYEALYSKSRDRREGLIKGMSEAQAEMVEASTGYKTRPADD